MRRKMNKSELERFEDKYTPEPNSGCWLWLASDFGGFGYGAFCTADGKTIGAHRASWQLHRGPIPKKTMVLHRCDVPFCVNPAHLWLGTQADNVADRSNKRRTRNQWTGPLTAADKKAEKEGA